MIDVGVGVPGRADEGGRPEGRTVVLGLGTPLMADDGVGLAALEELRSWSFSPGLELVDGGTWGMNLLGLVEDAGRLLLLDAIHAGSPAGSLVELRGEEIPRYLFTKVSPHQVDFREVLALAELRGKMPAEIVALGLVPERIEMSYDLTPLIRARLPVLVEEALGVLGEWGHRAAFVGSIREQEMAGGVSSA